MVAEIKFIIIIFMVVYYYVDIFYNFYICGYCLNVYVQEPRYEERCR